MKTAICVPPSSVCYHDIELKAPRIRPFNLSVEFLCGGFFAPDRQALRVMAKETIAIGKTQSIKTRTDLGMTLESEGSERRSVSPIHMIFARSILWYAIGALDSYE